MTDKAKKPPAPSKKAGAVPKSPLMVNDKDWNRERVMEIVCDALATSSRAVGTILKEGYEGWPLPHYATFARWIAEPGPGEASNPLCELYARAKEAQADYMAEELAEIHNKAWIPVLDPETGKPERQPDGTLVMTVDRASAQIVRLEADNKKWLMAKLRPKKYGEKVEHGGKVETAAPVVNLTLTAPKGRADG